MAVGERPALHVLPRQADVVALDQERSERHGLRGPPVDVGAALRHRLASLEDFPHLAMQSEALRDLPRLLTNVAKSVDVYASGSDAAVLPRGLEPRPPGAQPVLDLRLVALAGLVVGLVGLQREVADLLRILLRQGALLDQPLLVDIQRGRVTRNGLVQFGLGEHRLVHLVVAEAAVADHVDHDVRAPLVPKLYGGLERAGNGDGIVAVDVEDGAVERLPEVGRVGGGPAVDRVGREPDLVVHDDVDGPPDVEVVHPGQLHRLVHHPLPREGRVAVEEDRDDVAHVLRIVAAVELLRAGLPADDGVDALEMGRVGHEAEMDLATVRIGPVHARSHVVLKSKRNDLSPRRRTPRTSMPDRSSDTTRCNLP